ncbi:hypothetical protein [Sabulibacter ruber]|nr:hypothetical protein [Sabulibacter ruber]
MTNGSALMILLINLQAITTSTFLQTVGILIMLGAIIFSWY